MPAQIILLRAVNVGGRGAVAMADLRDYLTRAGFSDVRTILQSGNIVLQTPGPVRSAAKLETQIEAVLLEKLSLKTSVISRSASAWQKLIAANPFPNEARNDPGHLVAMLTKTPPTKAAVDALKIAADKAGAGESVAFSSNEIYITFPGGIGRSRLTGKIIERTLATIVTGRNWNTILKIAVSVAAASADAE